MTAKAAIEDAKKATKHNLNVKIFMAIPVISDSTVYHDFFDRTFTCYQLYYIGLFSWKNSKK